MRLGLTHFDPPCPLLALTAGLAMSLAHGRAQVDKFFADGSDAPGAAAVNGTGAAH